MEKRQPFFWFTLFAIVCAGLPCLAAPQSAAPAENVLLKQGIQLLSEGKYDEARKLNASLLPLMQVNFIETNPIPVKAALAMMGRIEENYRLPLCPMKPENRAKLEKVLTEQGLLQAQKV